MAGIARIVVAKSDTNRFLDFDALGGCDANSQKRCRLNLPLEILRIKALVARAFPD